ncbi:helix-turn-helix domain-containing protein [Streptomyces atroolivaceus]|uniref:helix-turn-helix domain-containing protein n=1 Tax=Streptomyces atroolivaceus TaxID=66869 RepID=UPI00365BBF96
MSTEQATPPEERRGTRRELTRRPRLRGNDRVRVRTEMAKKYDADASIRDLAAEYDLSFGLTRTLLLEADVELRSGRRHAKAAGQ